MVTPSTTVRTFGVIFNYGHTFKDCVFFCFCFFKTTHNTVSSCAGTYCSQSTNYPLWSLALSCVVDGRISMWTTQLHVQSISLILEELPAAPLAASWLFLCRIISSQSTQTHSSQSLHPSEAGFSRMRSLLWWGPLWSPGYHRWRRGFILSMALPGDSL